MKNVQQHLDELDIRQLLNRYFCDYPIDFEPPALKDNKFKITNFLII